MNYMKDFLLQRLGKVNKTIGYKENMNLKEDDVEYEKDGFQLEIRI